MKQTGIVMYSTSWCADCRRSKSWLDTHGVVYKDINIEESEEATDYVEKLTGRKNVPTIVFSDGSFLIEPNDKALEEKIKSITKV